MSTRSALRRRALRPAAVAAGTWAAAALAISGASPVAILVALVVGSIGCVAVFFRTRRAWVGVLAVTLAFSGAAAGTAATLEPVRREVAAFSAGGGRHLVVETTVTGRVSTAGDGGAWFDATASRLSAGRAQVRGAIPVRVGVSADARDALAGAGPGSVVVVTGTAFEPDRGERALLVVRGVEVVSVSAPDGVWGWFDGLRTGLVASTRGLPGPGAGLVPGLAVGDTSALDPSTEEAMNASSLSHLTAVSGANCAIVVAAAFAVLAAWGAPRVVRVLGAVGVLAGFVVLVTPEPSVVRAATMAAIALLAVALGRPALGVAVLSAAVTAVLVSDPWIATSLGFALSVVATAALLVLARPIADGLQRWMPRPLALTIAVPTAAQVACGPLIVLIDPHVPLLGIVANLLADPAAAPATIAGVLACIAPVPWLRDGLTALAWVPASWIAAVAHTTAGLGAQNLPWVAGPVGALLLAVVGAAGVVLVRGASGSRRAWHRVAAVIMAVCVGVVAGQTTIRTFAGPLTLPRDWQVAMCDVGQGDATLWRDAGATALVDTGPDPDALTGCLERFGVTRLDLLVLTHFDLDHVGGAGAVVGRVDRVLHGPPAERADERLLRDLADAGARLERADVGRTGTVGRSQWSVLWPPSSTPAGNDASIVLDVVGPTLPRTILLGDLGAEPQRALARRVAVPVVRVVKVSHHGSADQDPDLYRRLDADIGLIGVGADNDYGHPTASLLSTLVAVGTRVGRTDLHGTLAVWLDGDGRLSLWRERDGAPPAPPTETAAAAPNHRVGRPR